MVGLLRFSDLAKTMKSVCLWSVGVWGVGVCVVCVCHNLGIMLCAPWILPDMAAITKSRPCCHSIIGISVSSFPITLLKTSHRCSMWLLITPVSQTASQWHVVHY